RGLSALERRTAGAAHPRDAAGAGTWRLRPAERHGVLLARLFPASSRGVEAERGAGCAACDPPQTYQDLRIPGACDRAQVAGTAFDRDCGTLDDNGPPDQ